MIARILGPSYALRCVVFHDISAEESPFTSGMGVSISPRDFEAALSFLARYYTPVRLQDVLTDCDGLGLPSRPMLVTFDDGYASVMKWAAPLCARFNVPAIVFLNAAFLDNDGLAPDNLVCYAANVLGMDTINAAARAVKAADTPQLESMSDVFSRFFPSITVEERRSFLDILARLGGIGERQLAGEANLYLTRQEVCELAAAGFEMGNHTYSHVRCRSLSPKNIGEEIDRNKAELESISGKQVQSFSLPYGSAEDLTSEIMRHLWLTRYKAVFLSESVANPDDTFQFDRVSIRSNNDASLFFEIEVLPRLRAIRNRLSRFLYRHPRRGRPQMSEAA
jgi:peptidoglycan/xylan/chitin deacetylase (PgdA/CDA1 family)